MHTYEVPVNERLETLFRCPRCKGQLSVDSTILGCPNCDATYSMRRGIIPMFSFYVDENPAESGRDPEQIWNRDGFEHGYENIGYHESGAEFDTQLGYPAELSNFIFERVKKRMVEWIVPAADHSILDIGCGAGYLLYLIYEKYRRHGFTPTVTGVDISTFQLSYMARRMHKEGIYDAVVVHGNGEYLPFANNSFDFVTCSEVLEHIRNPNRALSEMHRVLKPAGRVLLSTPSMTAEKGWTLLLSPAAVLVKAIRGHKSESPVEDRGFDVPWYPKEFKKAIRFAGFEINDFEYNAVIPHPWYFKFLPKLFVKPVIGGFGIVDHYLKFMLRPLALHFVVRASKVVDSGKNR